MGERHKVLSALLQKLGQARGYRWVHVGSVGRRKEGRRDSAHVAAADEHVYCLRQGAPHKIVACSCVAGLQDVGGEAGSKKKQSAVHKLQAQIGQGSGGLRL
jgi:hypothetical protein